MRIFQLLSTIAYGDAVSNDTVAMEKAIKQNARVMDTMKPFLCGVKNCPNRKSITFDTNNN